MAFDISKLTSAVNKYLNSISDIGNAASKARQEAEEKSRFSLELSEAIKENMQSRMRDEVSVPDISSVVQNEINHSTAGIDATIEQINGAFETISHAGKVSSVGNQGLSGEMASSDESNFDAYSGALSTEALQELSKSQYFSSNLIQSSLFEDSSEGTTDSGSKSAFDTVSLSDLNTNSLLSNSLLKSGSDFSEMADSIIKAAGTNNNENVLSDSSSMATDSSDIAKALIKAYTAGNNSSGVTSIFGDFSL